MSYDADRLTIRNLLDAGWGTTTPICYSENEPSPVSGNWIRLNVLNAAAQRSALSQKKYRHEGIVVVQIFTERNNGNGLAIQYGDSLASIFRGAAGGGMIFRAATVREIGPAEGWFQTNVEIPFQRDEVF